jgi:hypothetical protein
MFRKILNFGVVLPHIVYNLYKIPQLVRLRSCVVLIF